MSLAVRAPGSLSSILILLLACGGARAGDTYNPATGTLTIPSLAIGDVQYSNVVLHETTANIAYVHGGAPASGLDTYDPSTGLVSISSVNVNGTTYTNVGVTVGRLVSIGAANFIDVYDAATGQLRIAAVKAGAATYNNVLISAGPANISGIAGGMPSAAEDVFSGTLLVPAVQVGSQIYTNVTLKVGTGNIVSVGGASAFIDAPVVGLCYSTIPSSTATAAMTNLAGQFLYATGDSVTLWIDGSGSGNGCAGSSATLATSVLLGTLEPTGPMTSVLALPGGAQVADTLTALNIGVPDLFLVGDFTLNPADAANMTRYIKTEGYSLASVPASIDQFFNQVQLDTTLAGGPPPFATLVAANASTSTSVLEETTTANLISAAAALPNQPATYVVPAGGELLFSVDYLNETCPVCTQPTALYTGAYAEFTYLDGKGNVQQLYDPGVLQNTLPLADVTAAGTYTVSSTGQGAILTLTLNGTDYFSGDLYSYVEAHTARYRDASTSIDTFTLKSTYTSGAQSGQVFTNGAGTTSMVRLTPLTPALLAGHSFTQPSSGCPGGVNTFTFVGDASSVTATFSCGGNPLTMVPSSMPGILLATDSTGFTAFVGLRGPLAVGSSLALIQVALGSQGLNGNGNAWEWGIGKPFLTVN